MTDQVATEMAIVYPTSALKTKERFDYWQDVVCSTFVPTTNRQLADEPFDGRLDVTMKGGVSYSRIKSHPIQYERDPRDDGSDQYFIALSLCPNAYVSQCNRVSQQRPGDIVLFDSARPYTCTFPAGDDQIVLAVPRTQLELHIPGHAHFLNRTLESTSTLGSLATTLLTEAWKAQPVPDTLGEQLNGACLDVLSSAFEAAYGSATIEQISHRDRQVEKVKQFLLRNLDQTDLTVQSISAAVHVSPRTLSRLFAAEGTTVIRWLWQQRLSASHAVLIKGQIKQVSQVALSFGFTNLSHFSRAFKQAYGLSPQQLLRQYRVHLAF